MSVEIIAFAVVIVTVLVAASGKGAVWSAPALVATFLLAVGSFAVVSVSDHKTNRPAAAVASLMGGR